jgi:hypothetical protein
LKELEAYAKGKPLESIPDPAFHNIAVCALLVVSLKDSGKFSDLNHYR